MPVLRNIGTLAACRADGGQGAVHIQRDAALAWDQGVISWVGPDSQLPAEFRTHETIDAERRLVVPGLIDCHTHLAFAGWRADEFVERIRGRSYLEIAAAGGGILRTVEATRSATSDELLALCSGRLEAMSRLGVTTVEAKSGYGLDVEHELRILRVYQELRRRHAVRVIPTFLGAHTVPARFRERRAEYVDLMIDALPEIGRLGLARFCDVFVEESAFSVSEARAILRSARTHGLMAKLHADQLSDGGGAALAAELEAVSADHLECISEDGIGHLSRSGTVAVSLPIASLYLGRVAMPARRLIAAGVPVAVATDFNPGTAPTFHLPLALLLACTLQRMTPDEALKGATIYAARAIGEDAVAGSLEPGKRADFAVIDAPDIAQWLYHFTANRCVDTYIGGRQLLNLKL